MEDAETPIFKQFFASWKDEVAVGQITVNNKTSKLLLVYRLTKKVGLVHPVMEKGGQLKCSSVARTPAKLFFEYFCSFFWHGKFPERGILRIRGCLKSPRSSQEHAPNLKPYQIF